MSNDRPLRIFHGPHNICGIGGFMAAWERQHGLKSYFLVYRDHTPQNNSDENLHLEKRTLFAKALLPFLTLARCLFKYDVFHFYSGITFLRGNLDLPILKLFGKKIILTTVGSEVRLSEIENHRNPYFRLMASTRSHRPNMDRLKKQRLTWQGYWSDRVIAVRDLYAPVKSVINEQKIIKDLWVTTTIDLKQIQPDYRQNEIPIIVHAPTNPQVKGSQYVEQAVEKLRQAGYKFEYVRLQNKPSREAMEIYQSADIIVDQLLIGAFGNLSVEGMALGKPVCVYLLDEICAMCPGLPLVNCTIETLEEKLAWLIQHPEERLRLGQLGRAYVEKHHDRDKIGWELVDLYRQLVYAGK